MGPKALIHTGKLCQDKCSMKALALPFIGVYIQYIQVITCYRSCSLYGLVADCSAQQHSWVPALPPNISHLYLQSNRIREINSTSLRDFELLQGLDLGLQHVQLVIRNNSFLKQKRLTHLVLGHNIGLQLELRAFSGLFNLQNLFLDYCGLTDSILAESFLQPLLSLEMLDLFGNQIVRLQPGQFFTGLTKLTRLNLKLNQIERLCEEDLEGFTGKYFEFLNLDSNNLYKMASIDFDWEKCGNPFKGMGIKILDISTSGFNESTLKQFLRATAGTPIDQLIASGYIGKGFSFANLPDPDKSTFEGLRYSGLRLLNLANNRIFALQSAVFSPLRNAIIVDVSQNKINQIDSNAFDGLQGHLRMLNLSFNLLGEIFSHTFTNLTELWILDLSYNHIGALGHEAFSGLPNLQELYLTGNSLRDLGSPALLPNIRVLFLGDNRLWTLYSVANLGMKSTHIDVSQNRLTNLVDVYSVLTHFKYLQNIYFGGNFIKWCNLGPNTTIPVNNSLQVLDLHDSSLQIIWAQGQCLDLFNHLDNLLGLNLSFNSLAVLPQGIFSGLGSVIEMDLSSNALTHLPPDVFPSSLKTLYLSNNFLAYPDPKTFQSLLFLSLSVNRFYCDCNLESFLMWLNMTNVTFLSPVEEFKCEFPADLYNLPLLEYSTMVEPCAQDDERDVQDLKFALFILCTLLVLTVLFCGICYAHFRGHIFIIYKKIVGRVLEGPKPPVAEEEVQYDAYLCFSDSDYRWVEVALLKKLDNKFSEENILRCCFEARDFLPGEDHLSNIRDAIWGSRKTVCIVSKEFLKDGWCLEVFTLAQSRMLEELKNVLIMVVVGKVAHYQLVRYNAVRAFVQRREYLIWPEDPQDLEWFYERLVSQILKDTELKRPTEEQARPEVLPQPENAVQLQDIRAAA
ncbi:toll-like receptor 5 [Aulostomus maculatus]